MKVALFKAGGAGRSNGQNVTPLWGSFYVNLQVLWPGEGHKECSSFTPITDSQAVPEQLFNNPATPPWMQ